MRQYTSDDDLEHYFGKRFARNILKYSDIDKYPSIDKLIPGKQGFKIILVESSFNSGHWVCLLKYNDTIEYFDPYGLKPSIGIDGNSYLKNKQLNQDVKHLNILLNDALGKYNILYNKIKFQKLNPDIATCGRHVIFRCSLFKTLNMNIYQYIEFFDEMKKKFKLTPDEIVTLLVDSHNNI
jgi:hypothetical protein